MAVNIGLMPVILGAALIIGIGLGLRLALMWIGRTRRFSTRVASLTGEELDAHEKQIAAEHLVSKRKILLNWPLPRLNSNYEYILATYKNLNTDLQNKLTVQIAAEWLLDNFYVIERQVDILQRELTKKSYLQLPILKSGPFKGYARIFAIATDLVAHTDGHITETNLRDSLKAYQSQSVLLEWELWALPVMIRVALIEKIRVLCEEIQRAQKQWNKANRIFDEWLKNKDQDTDAALKTLSEQIEGLRDISPALIDHLSFRLRRSGFNSAPVLRSIDSALLKFKTSMDEITQKEHMDQSIVTVSMSNSITSLHEMSALDFADLIESVSVVDTVLRQDPAMVYPNMDANTRNQYRRKVEEIALIARASEQHIAEDALKLAAQAFKQLKDESRVLTARNADHVGYYLIGDGVEKLMRLEGKGALSHRVLACSRNHSAKRMYFGAIFFVTLIFSALAFWYARYILGGDGLLLPLLAGLSVLIPASEITSNFVNWIISRSLKPAFLPRMDLKSGIPEEYRAMVVIPTLLLDAERTHQLFKNLEEHYLVNREENLYFAIVSALKDKDAPGGQEESDILDAALSHTAALNQKYAENGEDRFFFCHRDIQFNQSNGKWIGWERKRGALLEFNQLLLGSQTASFSVVSSDTLPFLNIQYIITLDSDTILPIGMAKKLVAAMAHPLNRPAIDPVRGIVTQGYGLMQPRIDVEINSSNQSLFSRIFTDQGGIDPYANAISDVYQDLFGEGIFTGKGIYDLMVFQAVLKDAIPDNTILSHDLLEGSFVRAALVSDLNLIDSFPSGYQAYSARKHRWIRGDWQLLPYLCPVIRDRRGNRIKNPLSGLSRWKIFDNLRRSLVAPSLLLLALLGFSILPGDPWVWLGAVVVITHIPLVMALLNRAFSPWFSPGKTIRHTPQITGIKAGWLQGLLQLMFMPQQAALSLSAIFTTLARVLFTKRNLLQWTTSAEVEQTQKNSMRSYLKQMLPSLFMAAAGILLGALLKPDYVLWTLPIAILWAAAPFAAFYVSRNRVKQAPVLPLPDQLKLGKIARKTWRYFEEFLNIKNNYLPPDNYQENPPRGIAFRTSPTNIGLGLLAILSARDFGYIGLHEMIKLLDRTITVMEELEKWEGHLYNWYDTRTLRPLRPRYISTVDSGNLAGYLITLEQGLLDYLNTPLVDASFLWGVQDTLASTGQEDSALYHRIAAIRMKGETSRLDIVHWSRIIDLLYKEDVFHNVKTEIWEAKLDRMGRLFKRELLLLTPFAVLLPRAPEVFAGTTSDEEKEDLNRLLYLLTESHALYEMPGICQEALDLTAGLTYRLQEADAGDKRLVFLNEMEAMLKSAKNNAEQFILKYEALIQRVRALYSAMSFQPLFVEKKKLFSIGYNADTKELTNSYYDVFASEARQTSYISIARAEVPPAHWFRMGRSLIAIDRYKGLVSWSGTMFEYLMPLLIIKNVENTLLDETYSFVVKNQKKYGKKRKMPWGVSESAFNALDSRQDYQYKAIGVPSLGLKRGLVEDAVVSPYSTFLALLVDPAGAMRNIVRLEAAGADGPYGFYEALDYTPERLLYGQDHAIIKSYMAHHQGMSLAAINNALHQGIMQRRFHQNREMHAARQLLWEKIPAIPLPAYERHDKVIPARLDTMDERVPIRTFTRPDPVLPKVHILTNGSYMVMLTDRGTGFSATKMLHVSRWREDRTLDRYGMFFYIRNVETDLMWSAAYAPLNTLPSQYEAVFSSDKATFRRVDKQIETKTEVTIASGDNVEFRRLSLKNMGSSRCVLEVTSYFELVLAPLNDDIAHPAFSNLFIETAYRADKKYVLANRRPRSDLGEEVWAGSAVVADNGMVGKIQYETDRMQFLGRGNTVKSPAALEYGRPLSDTVGAVLDPVMSQRVFVQIEPGDTAVVTYVTALGQSNEALILLLDQYATAESVSQAFQLALARSKVERKYLGLSASQVEFFQNMLSDLLFISPARRIFPVPIPEGMAGQASLWAHGISGDHPIVLLTIKNEDQLELLFETLKAHEYWWLLGLIVDLVVVIDEKYSYNNSLQSVILDIVSLPQKQFSQNRAESIFVLNQNHLKAEDTQFLAAVARIRLHGDEGSLEDQMAVTLTENQLPRKEFTGVPSLYAPPVSQPVSLQYYNGFGGFKAPGDEYVIRLENSQNTPAPWINVVANPDFGFIASASGSGYTWRENSRENKLTPWSNDPVSDDPGEVFYIRDEDTGDLFTTTALPIRDEAPYTVTHGYGYTVFEHTMNGIGQKMTQFVPVGETVKISLITLTNLSERKRSLCVTYYMRPVLGVNDQTTAMHIKTSVSPAGALLIENPYHVWPGGQISFVDTSIPRRWVTGDRREFFGLGDMRAPASLLRENLSGATGVGFDPCGAMQVKVSLEPNQSEDIVFQLGSVSGLQEADALSLRYQNIGEAKNALREVKNFWRNTLGIVKVKTPTRSMNLILNGWLPYQVIACRLWARSAFYQSGGAYGFRDQLQDCLSVAHLWPKIARAQILLHAAHQYREGDVQHWWHEHGGGIRSRITDDRLWLPYAAAEYLRITGDTGILSETVPYLESLPLAEHEEERYEKAAVSAFSSTLYDHCVRAIDISLQFGSHGLPLMGTGDWNDGMNAVGSKGKGESVWLGWFLATVLKMFAPVSELMGEGEKALEFEKMREKVILAIEENAWDGRWYRRAYFDDGTPLGSIENQECMIDSIAQSWSVISGGGDPKRAETAMYSLLDHLVLREEGLVKLLTPPFRGEESDPGYISSYVPGVRENGGQYTHAAAWVIIAFAKMGDGDRAWELFRLINPIKHAESQRESFRYKLEPYVIAADVYTAPSHVGRGGWSWYTGSGGWMYRAGLEYILGFKKHADAIVMDPCIPRNWREYAIDYRYMDSDYSIMVYNPHGLSRGNCAIRVDGVPVSGNRFSLVNDGAAHEVTVTLSPMDEIPGDIR